jgi:hypothetical protein
MNPAGRTVLRLVVFVVLFSVLGLGPACGAGSTSSTTSTPVASASSASPANSNLDPAVAMPNGFPSDFPIYPGARLTHASQFTSNGQTSWGMEWETLDNAAAVQSFYMSKLNQGDWTLSFSGSGNGSYSAIFTRKSNQKDAGLLTVEIESNVTHIRIGFGTN